MTARLPGYLVPKLVYELAGKPPNPLFASLMLLFRVAAGIDSLIYLFQGHFSKRQRAGDEGEGILGAAGADYAQRAVIQDAAENSLIDVNGLNFIDK